MTQKFRITDIANIRVGFLPRKQLNDDSNGSTKLLQMRDLDLSGNFNYKTALHFDPSSKEFFKFNVKDGDVLLLNRGEPIRAALISSPPSNIIASAHFFIIRPTSNIVIPDFLAWILNQSDMQNYFRKNLAGTSVKMITIKSLEQMKISIPSKEIQQKIINLDNLTYKHKQLVEKIHQKIGLLTKKIAFSQISKH